MTTSNTAAYCDDANVERTPGHDNKVPLTLPSGTAHVTVVKECGAYGTHVKPVDVCCIIKPISHVEHTYAAQVKQPNGQAERVTVALLDTVGVTVGVTVDDIVTDDVLVREDVAVTVIDDVLV